MPIAYRRADDHRWSRARAINLSESGVLFGPCTVETGATVEIMLSPPMAVAGFATGMQVCTGEIVRATPAGQVAARFDECRFVLGT